MIVVLMLFFVGGMEKGWLVVVGVGFVFQGFGQGLCLFLFNLVVVGFVFVDDFGIVIGVFCLMNQIGMVIGIVFVIMVYGGDLNGFD